MAQDVILGANGMIEGVRGGSVVVDCSTIAVSQSRHIGDALKAKGVDFLDARHQVLIPRDDRHGASCGKEGEIWGFSLIFWGARRTW